jgi:hypothetical protein
MTTAASSAAPPAARQQAAVCEVSERALRIWPGLDSRSLASCGCDPDQIAIFVAGATSLSVEVITGILAPIERGEPPFYFG